MISKSLPKEAKQDFDIVVQVARNIGLADHPPIYIPQKMEISNTPSRRKRKRRINYSDLLPLEKEQKGNEVRQRGLSQRTNRKDEVKSNRKGSVKDVFIDRMKAYEDPQQFIKTQKAILSKDILRSQKQARDANRVHELSSNRKKRFSILGDISEGFVATTWMTPRKPLTAPTKYFGQKRSGRDTHRTVSFQKLALSLNFSKFQLVPRKDGVKLLSRENEERKVQTARGGSRRVQMCFGQNNRPELVYPLDQNESDLF